MAVQGRRGARTAADGNAAAAHAAYALSDAFFVYPITPSTGMSQTVEARSARGDANAYGRRVLVRQMQSEAGVAGALHGALQSGVLAASFTASQGLLLMVPTLYKVAGEGLPLVLHVTARAVSANGVTIHADHSDVYAVRQTGAALLASHSVQECADLAAAAHIAAATAATPVVHFFEGMQLSHEVADCALPTPAQLARLAPRAAVARFRARALSPAHPRSSGTVLGRDTFWPQAASDAPRHARVAQCVDDALAVVARATGRRRHGLFDYYGSPRAERVVVAMGAHAQTVQLAVRRLLARGERVGVVKVHLFRPWSAEHFCSVLPPTVRRIAVLDRAHEPGAAGDPLYLDVVASVAAPASGAASGAAAVPRLEHVTAGNYAIGDHDFSVAMAESVFAELGARRPRQTFSVGIVDDVMHSALPLPPEGNSDSSGSSKGKNMVTRAVAKVLGRGDTAKDEHEPYRCVFWGIGGDGTVSANRNAATILCEHRDDMAVRAAFHYDAHKTGGVTLSHLQFQKKTPAQRAHGDEVVMFHGGVGRGEADLVACHVPQYLARYDVLAYLKPGGTVLLNVPCATNSKNGNTKDTLDALEKQLPPAFRARLAQLGARLFVIDGTGLAQKAGLGTHTSTVLGAAFLKIVDCVGTPEQCAAWLKALAAKRYGQGSAGADAALLEKNAAAVDMGFAHVAEVHYPRERWLQCASDTSKGASTSMTTQAVTTGPLAAYDRDIGAPLRRLEGMRIPVSALLRHSEHGLTPCGTAALEKRGIAATVPAWDAAKCVQCNRCAFFCPHAAIRPFLLKGDNSSASTTETPKTVPCQGFEKSLRFRIQVSPLDCTACGACVKACPTGALAMQPAARMRPEARNWDALTGTGTGTDTDKQKQLRGSVVELRPSVPRDLSVRTSQLPRPLLEFAGACAGCPEPVYTKLLTQLYGDRLMLANGIGCSTVWSGTAFCSPVACGADGRGPAWGCSLFENNAEYGYGMALGSLVRRRALRQTLLRAAGRPRLSLVTRAALTACLATWDEAESDARMHIAAAVVAVTNELRMLRHNNSATAAAEKSKDKSKDKSKGIDKETEALVEDLESILRDRDLLLKRSHWMVGGDGWAHDIGFGGLDHVLATRTPVRVLVLDNENYANTGGQASKATSVGAVAKLASRGKTTPKKDLGLYALAMHPHAYVASVCYGADPEQTLRALREAEAHDGPALVVAYCPCIEHQPAGGFSGAAAIDHMRAAVRSGYWPLYTRTPGAPLRVTARRGSQKALDAFLLSEGRFSVTLRNHPERALLLRAGLQAQIAHRDRLLAKLAEAEAPRTSQKDKGTTSATTKTASKNNTTLGKK